MKIYQRIALVLAGALPFVSAQAQTESTQLADGLSLTVDQCVAIALSESPTIKVADMEITRLDYSKREVLGQVLPTIDFSGTYSRTIAQQVMYLNMSALTGGTTTEESDASSESSSSSDEGIKMGLDNSWSLGFSASMPLIAPQLWKSIQLSDIQIARAVEAARQSRQSLVNQVKAAYYALLLAEDSRKVVQESYDMAALTHEMYVKQNAVGAASDYDVLRTSVAMKNVEPELTSADISISRARLQLLILMGLESSVEIHTVGTLADYEKTMYETVLSTGDNFEGNADLRLLDIDAKLMQKSVQIQKMAFMPTLALTANYNWTSMSNGNPLKNFRWNPYSTVGVTLSVPIFSGGQRWNKLKEAKIEAEELEWQKTNLRRSISMQVDIARKNINLNAKQIASSAESVGQAERAHSIMERSFDIGAASYLELRDSELALTQARLAYNQSIYNFLVAAAELDYLLGEEVPEN